MNKETVLIIIGAIFILIGLAGRLKIRDGEVFIGNPGSRVCLLVIGFTLLIIGIVLPLLSSFGKNNSPSSCSNCIQLPYNSAKVNEAAIVKGNYSNIDEDLWVMIWPDLAGNRGWPQTDDALRGKPAYKSNGKWSVTCHFGGEPQNYDIVLYSADSFASQVFRNTVMKWANSDVYPGFSIDSLPLGLTEIDRITVRK